MIMLSVADDFNRTETFANLLGLFRPCFLVDLGAGTCWAARLAHDRGFSVMVVDIHPGRVPEDMLQVFVQADVSTVDVSVYDLIVCEGLLYHLSLDQQIQLVKRFAGKPVIFSTHVALHAETIVGHYSGQHRKPTWSSKVPDPWLHTLQSLTVLFTDHQLFVTASTPTLDRVVGLALPLSKKD